MSDSLTAATNAAAAAYVTSSASGTSSASSTGTAATPNALAQLGANFNQFLQLLLTQVQNQDPTAPTDTTQFTTELVQFTGVQEQVNANTSLGQLIGLQQSSQVLQSASLVGKQATVTANQITLQGGHGEIQFQGTAGEQVAIGVVDANGNPVFNANVTATTGTNTWQWNGVNNSGNQEPDGAYGIAVDTAATNGTATPVGYSVVGTTTGVSTSGTTTQLQLGSLSVGLSALQSVDQ
jgi:flagellar basal-body rod modification protein FlgD